MKLTLDVIRKLPKTELHCHLDGSLRPRTVLELAQQQNVKLPTTNLAKLTRLMQAGRRTRNLGDYLKIFDITLSVMQQKESLYRVAYELVEDCAAENVRHLEVRYSPILHRKRRLSFEDIVDPVIAGLRDAGGKHEVSTGVIICGIRSMPPRTSVALAELAVAYRGRGVLAFDLAGQERDYPAKMHREAFEIIHKNHINSTVHAGEAFGPASIAQALHYCGAHRIGHGTRLLEDEVLLRYVRDHRVPLEMCLSSNVQTRVSRTPAAHPFGQYFRQGLRVTLNTDNRLMSATTVTDEYWLAHTRLGFSREEIERMILYGFESAFLPHEERCKMVELAKRELGKLRDAA